MGSGSAATYVHRLVVSAAPIAHVDERYLCLCVDLGQIAEPTRFWNPAGAKGSTLETVNRSTYDFGRVRLRNMASALAPGLLRIGGTEADRVFYALDEPSLALAESQPPPPFKSVLKAARIDAIGEFATSVGFEVVFALNAGWATRTSAGGWDTTQARDLLAYIKARALPFAVFELGNEPNGWPYLQGGLSISPEQFARDLFALVRVRDELLPAAKVAAPSTAWFPSVGELPAPTLHGPSGGPAWMHGYLAGVLRASERLALPDIVTWHYYPGQSDRAVGLHRFRNASLAAAFTALALLLTLRFQSQVRSSVEEASASAFKRPRRVTSTAASTRCCAALYVALAALVCMVGAAVFEIVTPVTLHSLRTPAVLDRVKVWGAETLSGSDYGLIDDETMRPTAEFWASVLWRRLMGTAVFAASAEGGVETLRVYCHGALGGKSGKQAGPGQRSCVLLNLGDDAVTVDVHRAGGSMGAGGKQPQTELWLLRAEALNSDTLTINGEEPATDTEGRVPALPGVQGPPNGHVRLPPTSAAFVRIST